MGAILLLLALGLGSPRPAAAEADPIDAALQRAATARTCGDGKEELSHVAAAAAAARGDPALPTPRRATVAMRLLDVGTRSASVEDALQGLDDLLGVARVDAGVRPRAETAWMWVRELGRRVGPDAVLDLVRRTEAMPSIATAPPVARARILLELARMLASPSFHGEAAARMERAVAAADAAADEESGAWARLLRSEVAHADGRRADAGAGWLDAYERSRRAGIPGLEARVWRDFVALTASGGGSEAAVAQVLPMSRVLQAMITGARGLAATPGWVVRRAFLAAPNDAARAALAAALRSEMRRMGAPIVPLAEREFRLAMAQACLRHGLHREAAPWTASTSPSVASLEEATLQLDELDVRASLVRSGTDRTPVAELLDAAARCVEVLPSGGDGPHIPALRELAVDGRAGPAGGRFLRTLDAARTRQAEDPSDVRGADAAQITRGDGPTGRAALRLRTRGSALLLVDLVGGAERRIPLCWTPRRQHFRGLSLVLVGARAYVLDASHAQEAGPDATGPVEVPDAPSWLVPSDGDLLVDAVGAVRHAPSRSLPPFRR